MAHRGIEAFGSGSAERGQSKFAVISVEKVSLTRDGMCHLPLAAAGSMTWPQARSGPLSGDPAGAPGQVLSAGTCVLGLRTAWLGPLPR